MCTKVAPTEFTETDLARLMEDHQARVWMYLRYLGCDRDQADDLVQEVFLSVWRKPFEYRGEVAAATYLRRVAHNRFISECRRRRVRPAFRDLGAAESVWQEFARDDDGATYLEALAECMSHLTDRARRVLALFYRDGLSRQDIGERCSLTADGVKSAMRRARAALRDCVRAVLE